MLTAQCAISTSHHCCAMHCIDAWLAQCTAQSGSVAPKESFCAKSNCAPADTPELRAQYSCCIHYTLRYNACSARALSPEYNRTSNFTGKD
eukprot:2166-Heterococcus_DN1.PRE.2